MRRTLLLLLVLVTCSAIAQKKETPYVILLSFDGFRYDYVKKFNTPFFKAFIRKGAAADGLIPSFPSKTSPNHYTLITGLYPGHHGFVDNQFYDPSLKKRYGMRDKKSPLDTVFYGGTPLWQLTQNHGMKSASCFWVGSELPIQGRYPDYFLPYNESKPNEERVEQTLTWLKLPEKDRPHFISLYFSLVDYEGHKSGPHSDKLRESVMRADSILGLLMEGLKKIDLPVNVIVVSDHGMLELKQEESTYIPLFNLVDMSDTTSVFVNGGTQAHIYTKKVDSLYDILKKKEHNFKVYKKSEMPDRWRYNNIRSGDILIVASPGYYIHDQPRSFGNWNFSAFGVHGYDPADVKEMQGIFYACGPNIRRGATIKSFENVHVYPLVAKILGLKPPAIDGKFSVLESVYKK